MATERAKMIVHCREAPYDVYIGRPGPWGNPFKIGRDGTRDEVIRKYENWITAQLTHDTELRSRLAELKGKVLGCWCAPHKCHGDVLIKLLAMEMK